MRVYGVVVFVAVVPLVVISRFLSSYDVTTLPEGIFDGLGALETL